MHVCGIPPARGSGKQWWTCEECGQLWRRVDNYWRLTAREAH